MSGITLGKKYGVNPSVEICHVCGKEMGVVLFGASYKDENGKQIWLIPDMMRLDNAWQSPCPISIKDNGGDREFDARVNEFVYYNCDRVKGNGAKYFVRQSDYETM